MLRASRTLLCTEAKRRAQPAPSIRTARVESLAPRTTHDRTTSKRDRACTTQRDDVTERKGGKADLVDPVAPKTKSRVLDDPFFCVMSFAVVFISGLAIL